MPSPRAERVACDVAGVKKSTAAGSERLTWSKKKGGGPTSAEGKKRSSQNATKHGCRSQTKILPGESAEEYQQLWQDWLSEYIPQSNFDLNLIEMAVNCQWRLRRAEKALDDVERATLSNGTQRPTDGLYACAASKWSDEDMRRLQLMQRYRTSAENSFNKAWRAVEFMKDRKEKQERALESRVKDTVEMVQKPALAKLTAYVAEEIVSKSGKPKNKPEEAPKTLAQQLFQGQNHAKNKKKIVRLEQWVEVRVVDGKTVTTLYPSNKKLIEEGKGMLPPPEYVYRRINFPDGIPAEYEWAGVMSEEHRERGGCGLQRMTIDTWLEVIEREKLRKDGHIGPTGVGNMPRPKEHGPCPCPMCAAKRELEEEEARIAEEREREGGAIAVEGESEKPETEK